LATIHGKNAIIYLQGSGSDAVALVEANEFTIDIDFDTEPDTAFGDSWETNLRGIARWSGTIMGNHDTAQQLMFDGISAASSRKAYFYPDRAVAARYYYGTIWPRLSDNIPFGVGKFTSNFQGDGELAVN
jgi:hypothetical protein